MSTTDYTTSRKIVGLLYGCNLLDAPPDIYHSVQTTTAVVLPSVSESEIRPVMIVRAPMGSGKTTALIHWLSNFLNSQDKSVLVVSCRRSFTQSLAARFAKEGLDGFVTYIDTDNYVIDSSKYRRLIIQIESLHRIANGHAYDVLILDETMSIVTQFFSHTMKKLNEADDALVNFIRTSRRVILMDATINNQLIKLMRLIRSPFEINLLLNNYTSDGFKNRVCRFLVKLEPQLALRRLNGLEINVENETDESFFGGFINGLLRGDNICVFSATVSFSNIIYHLALTYTKRVLLINSDFKNVDVTQWTKYQVVIYTTVVTVGISFDHHHFHSMYVYIKPMIYGPDMMSVYQSMGRVRTLLNNTVYLYIDGSMTKTDFCLTPLLLNEFIPDGSWNPEYLRLSEMTFELFKRGCNQTHRLPSLVARAFMYKHYLERCTLVSLNDSFNMLHVLLSNNKMEVLVGNDGCLDANSFYRFIRDLKYDCRKNITFMKHLRELIKPESIVVPISDDSAREHEEPLLEFAAKYLNSSNHLDLYDLFKQQINRELFVNAVMVRILVKEPMLDADTFSRLYSYYGNDDFPWNNNGNIEYVVVTTRADTDARFDAYTTCANLFRELKILSHTGIVLELTDLATVVIRYHLDCIRVLLSTFKISVTDHNYITKGLKQFTAFLSGDSPETANRPYGLNEYCLSLFKILVEQMLGIRVLKKQGAFPGGKKMKNLTKEDIRGLLTSNQINFSECATHKTLYRLLMSHKEQFNNPRVQLKGVDWNVYIKEYYSHPTYITSRGT
ncbi:DNA replication origin-binding helicase [Testudinid alphaherpesvirus 3]|uniref:Replication origin-binding protein n=1 Tax=Testudinid alphaherpesvirus 3 TaxID=2560801 RepID=A0A0K1R196_9ALPH|nr:DNA replication origin-binding helicase [Testudinid alphaherpesvirus 3]AIU39286.1 DNA replication origin-binding helicase [Testudinid alphaherpesvirus 3]AIU39396.1 DNA replication origin-binding helicase [Testudinid alphaherpesvirus 3]AKI81672.1 DNA replication origin-binding helicase [Testudinid alphaherpesvirus 3]AKI81775.1 DNA replication origin-binding helicase [Testudinid alphaherpesvirus 3]AKV40680.1 UL9 replication origin binding protein [Testudinid alphaherpesvirus 3]